MNPPDLLLNGAEVICSSHLPSVPTFRKVQRTLVHHVLQQEFSEAMTDALGEMWVVGSQRFEETASETRAVGILVTQRVQQRRHNLTREVEVDPVLLLRNKTLRTNNLQNDRPQLLLLSRGERGLQRKGRGDSALEQGAEQRLGFADEVCFYTVSSFTQSYPLVLASLSPSLDSRAPVEGESR